MRPCACCFGGGRIKVEIESAGLPVERIATFYSHSTEPSAFCTLHSASLCSTLRRSALLCWALALRPLLASSASLSLPLSVVSACATPAVPATRPVAARPTASQPASSAPAKGPSLLPPSCVRVLELFVSRPRRLRSVRLRPGWRRGRSLAGCVVLPRFRLCCECPAARLTCALAEQPSPLPSPLCLGRIRSAVFPALV